MDLMRVIVMLVVVGGAAWAYFAWQGDQKPQDPVATNTPSVSAQPKDPYVMANAAFIVFKYQAALDQYRKALEEQPEHADAPTAMYRVGKCLQELGEKRQAMEAYKRYVRAHPAGSHTKEAKKQIELMGGEL